LNLASYHPSEIYSLDTVFGRLHFRDNFGDITNIVKLLYQGEYKIRALAQQGAIFDVGANIGLAAVWFAHFNPAHRIFCFEPLPENVALIRMNCPRAYVEQVALGAQPGTVKLKVDSHGVMASKIPSPSGAIVDRIGSLGEIEFTITTVDAFAESHKVNRVALLKIDAEGMEDEILQGAAQVLHRTSQIVLETHGRHRHDWVVDFLKGKGFAIDSASFVGSTGVLFASAKREAVSSFAYSTPLQTGRKANTLRKHSFSWHRPIAGRLHLPPTPKAEGKAPDSPPVESGRVRQWLSAAGGFLFRGVSKSTRAAGRLTRKR
jgi:FkbM family methyltransferase